MKKNALILLLVLMSIATITSCESKQDSKDTNGDKEEVTYDQNSWKTIIPKTCKSFFDGCNNCQRNDESGEVACTLMACEKYEKPKCNDQTSSLTETDARAIAEKSCIKGGEALSAGTYNQNTKTWWFDANLNATREGCNPACVVSEESKTAEINWRCTGLITPDQPATHTPTISGKCGIENCHGLNIVCGPNQAEICTEMYQLGDRCRQFAQCGVVNGVCQQIENPEFNACKSCAEKCEQEFPDDPEEVFTCESKCGM